jgi:hypothetical protein
MDQPRKRLAATMSGLDIRYDFGDGHPLLGRPDIDLITANGSVRFFSLLHSARPVAAPSAVLIRPDGYVAWVAERTEHGLAAALTQWFGPAA